jgi:predicted Fe-Mo cluster-binding NifX family protein
MKIAVTSTGETLNSEVDPRFGRARYLIVIDSDTGEVESMDNRMNRDALHGAGVRAGEALILMGARVLITGHCGPTAFRVLDTAGITVVTGAAGRVKDVLALYEKGDLKEARAPDVKGRWA